ncbi:LuxR C-terminal-related transcriptional regulator [Anaeromyxobacter dehalogenans]|uniref:Transcriptional regulator, LuxR family n=1 Tax=Anaeromyxobacter dehalogenans (strain 2CP-C) TaxID=290397 RepID=Q2IMR0_ANADE|nr:LuxR family transcriptional regulator [Anaeromyxobacter dehalogenans]ABC80093.1 transcriptional regulator, LuxR family [Anaeromyxobacter dehalogenans 2CP-C]
MTRARSEPDWGAIALAMLERGREPAAWVDAAGTVRLATASLERLLGAAPRALEGRPVAAVLTGAPALADGRVEREVTTAAGRRLRVALEPGCEPACEPGALLRVLEVLGDLPGLGAGELDYAIETAPGAFGRLAWVRPLGGAALEPVPAARCHEALHGRSEPCADCPVRGGGTWPRVHARTLAPAPGYEVVTAAPEGAERVHLTVRRLAEAAVHGLVEARARALARGAGLSEREEAVLNRLLQGEGLADIGRALGITLRTVKFHQANLLRKLGAESRADLARVLM